MDIFLKYLTVFLIGGALCAVAQLFLIKTKWTPSRILVGFMIFGMLLEAFNIFEPIKNFAYSGITVPIIGFGALLAKGAKIAVENEGILGAFTGPLVYTALGVGGAIIFSYIAALIFKPHTK